jgi:hypothetical protein
MNVLNLCIGLIFVFLIFAIVVSGVQEWWAQFRGQRGRFLRQGMQRLIDDEAIFVRVLQHPLVGSLYRDRAAQGTPPSYVDPTNFALALANVIQRRALLLTPGSAVQPLTFQSLRAAAEQIAGQRSPVADSLLPILDQAEGDLGSALKGIEAWFSGGMDRVSGWYKAFAQRRLFVIGFIAAVIGNVDTIAIYQALNRAPDLAARIGDSASVVVHSGTIAGVDLAQLGSSEVTGEQAKAVLDAALRTPLGELPIGYACLSSIAASKPAADATGVPQLSSTIARCGAEMKSRYASWAISDWLVHLLGFALTALAGTLGAPYWFGLLSKAVNIRGSGPKPKPTCE